MSTGSVILILLIMVLAFLFYASYYVGSNVYVKARCSVKTDKKEIAVTFDDGPHSEKTPAILDILKKYNIKAAFFCIGTNIAGNEEILKRIHNEGHIVGNHTFTHSTWFDLLSIRKMTQDLQKAEELILSVTGKRVRFFRPPYGVTNPMLAKAIKKMKYDVIGWNIRSLDTVKNNREQVVQKVINRIKPGSVILLHDRCVDSELVVNDLAKYAVEQGYTFVRPDILFNLRPYD